MFQSVFMLVPFKKHSPLNIPGMVLHFTLKTLCPD